MSEARNQYLFCMISRHDQSIKIKSGNLKKKEIKYSMLYTLRNLSITHCQQIPHNCIIWTRTTISFSLGVNLLLPCKTLHYITGTVISSN